MDLRTTTHSDHDWAASWRRGVQGLLLEADAVEPPVTPPKPTLYYAITYDCPRSCAFCFNQALPPSRQTFNRDSYVCVLDQMAELSDSPSGPLNLVLSGGEPLVYPEVGDRALEASGRGLSVSLTTAGVPVSDEQLDKLAEAGTHVTLSFDSVDLATYERTRGSGTYGLALAALPRLDSHGLLERAIVVATRDTDPHLEATLRFLIEQGIPEVIVMEVTGSDALVAEIGTRIARERLVSLQSEAPHVRFVLGHQCPVTLNVDPAGRFYVHDPLRDWVRTLGDVTAFPLSAAYQWYTEAVSSLSVFPSEVLEPAGGFR